jgi:tetratricopeptide (TPR) repeat protein
MEEEPSASVVSVPAQREPAAEVEPAFPSGMLADQALFDEASTESEPQALGLDEEVVPTDSPPPLSPEGRAEGEFREQASGARSKTKMKVSVRDLMPEEGTRAEEPPIKENEYYDLASELGDALDGLQGPEDALFDDDGKSPEEMSFEEVFEEFKKGVEKKVGEEDYATHYNLGIAYKEMELLDEAVGEFQIAARSPQYFVECCSMLGICFRLKGLNELAEKWYRKGIAAPGFAEDVYVGLKYDLADCLAEQGRPDEANDLFKEVYAIQSNYRDVKDRIKRQA